MTELDEETIDIILHKIKLTEVERDVNNHRTMIAETVLPILEKIDFKYVNIYFINNFVKIECSVFIAIGFGWFILFSCNEVPQREHNPN